MSVCRSCGAPVVWAVTVTGAMMPVDRDPVDGGNIDLVHSGDASGTPTAHVLSESQPTLYGGDRYVSHFATCPNAAEHRR